MGRWKYQPVDGFRGRLERVRKDYPKETKAVFVNLDRFLGLLNQGVLPREIKAGFIHHERKGVVAIDQSGCDGSAAQVRLYIHSRDFTVYLITIGDKASQKNDIRTSQKFVSDLRRGR